MLERRLGDFVEFLAGINPTRAQRQFKTTDIDYYDQAAFERDYKYQEDFVKVHSNKSLREDIGLLAKEVVISNSLQLAAIVSQVNAGRVPSLNFTRVKFLTEELDKGYFIYLFNAYSGVKRQKERELQRSGSILRIPNKALEEIMIPIISIKEQRRIGEAYSKMRKMQSKLTRYTELMEALVGAILEENLKEKQLDERLQK